MAAEQMEYVGWQFRYVFEDQGNRRSDWSTVSTGEPSFTSGYRSYNGWQRRFYFEVRRVYADATEPYTEDPHHKPPAAGLKTCAVPDCRPHNRCAACLQRWAAEAEAERNAGVDLPDGAKG